MSIQKFSKIRNLVIYTLFVIVFFPTFWGYTSLSTGQLIYLFVSVFGTVPVFIGIKAYKNSLPNITSIFLLWSCTYLATLAIQPFLGREVIIKDFTDAARPVIYLYFFILGFVFGKKLNIGNTLVNVLVVCVCASCVFDIIKFFEVFQPITKLYAVFEFGYLNYIRYSGTFGFCYDFGFVLIFIYSYSILSFKFKTLIFIGGCMIMLLVGSRSVLATFAVVNIILFFTSSIPSYKKILMIPIIILFVWLIYFVGSTWEIPVISDTIEYAQKLYDTIKGVGTDASYDVRTSQKNKAFSRFVESPIFGVGPTKGESPIEMQLGYYISSWGLIGFLIFLFIQFCFLDSAIKGMSGNRNEFLYKFSKSNAVWIVSSFLAGMSTPITDQIRVFQIYFIIQGCQYAMTSKSACSSYGLLLLRNLIRKPPHN